MAPFPDDLPPVGLDSIYKLIIYYSILFVLATAITSWLITRKRKPKAVSSSTQVTRKSQEILNFADTKDTLASMKVEIASAEAALTKLTDLMNSGELSQTAYSELNKQFADKINEIQGRMSSLARSDIVDSRGTVVESISDQEFDELEADLEKQLMDLEDDSFLKSKPTKAPKTPMAEMKPSAPTPVTPKPKATPKAMPPSTPMATASAPAPPQPPNAISPAAPPSTPMASQSKVAPPPPPNKSSLAPPPPSTASKPLSAAQPMKVKAEGDDEGIFAKTTSIAALRMDMLRELARLKKLIPEDQEREG